MTHEEQAAGFEALCRRHAGVRFVGFDSRTGLVSPREAWKYVVTGDSSKASMTFSDEHLAQAQAEWWRLALSNRFFSSHNICLISMAGIGGWARIHLPTHAPVLDIFAPYKNCPEFLAMSESGELYLAVTSEEYEAWLYLVDCRGGQLRTIKPP
jgi:hypothetical protein